MTRNTRSKPFSEINVTPFVDVMLVLLIIFMVTAPLLTVGVQVDLPETNADTLQSDNEPLEVTIDASGNIFIQETEIGISELVPKMKAITENRLDTKIYVRGDEAIDTGSPIQVPVGPETLGRIINVIGEPIDQKGDIKTKENWPIHRQAPSFNEQSTETEILVTGIKVIDLLAPYAKGGKIGLFGGAGVGKTVIIPIVGRKIKIIKDNYADPEQGTGALKIPVGTTGQRPTAATGQLRFNSTDGKLEVYTGSAWSAVGSGGTGNHNLDAFTGDGSTTAFTLTVTPSDEDSLTVFIDGAYQEKGDYSLSGTTLTLDTAPLSGEKVSVHTITGTIHDGTAALNQQFTGDGSTTAFTLNASPLTVFAPNCPRFQLFTPMLLNVNERDFSLPAIAVVPDSDVLPIFLPLSSVVFSSIKYHPVSLHAKSLRLVGLLPCEHTTQSSTWNARLPAIAG